MPNINSPGVQKLLQYWGVLLSTAAQRLTTAQIWADVKSAANSAGNNLAGVTIQDMNFLRSATNSLLNAASILSKAADDATIEAAMISRAPWASLQQGDSLVPEWSVRYAVNIEGPEGAFVQWMTDRYVGSLPATVGELRDQLGDAADVNLEGGTGPAGSVSTGVGQMQIIIGL
jgi:hypothetical protein